jgi:hypothetical protein
LFCSARERSNCSAKSTTIFRSVSASRGKLFGSTGTVHLDYAETGPFPRKNNSKLKCFLRARAPSGGKFSA